MKMSPQKMIIQDCKISVKHGNVSPKNSTLDRHVT